MSQARDSLKMMATKYKPFMNVDEFWAMKNEQDKEWLTILQTAQMNKYQALCVRAISSDKTKLQMAMQVLAEKDRFDELSPKPAVELGCDALLKVVAGFVEFAEKNKRAKGQGKGKAASSAKSKEIEAPQAAPSAEDAQAPSAAAGRPAAGPASSSKEELQLGIRDAASEGDCGLPSNRSGRGAGRGSRGGRRGGRK